ncbi:hypothetical protein [Pedobacter montanisoli]|uniref:DUF4168 domain-containing protein n=1 Tax=Pedobacter montanisoli TaxID=2923277 RepID=A0ABS9ZZN5_9SPHI|nr:hypothetical protein [Pedobacter montanisoli]MCJ0743774.1 hypothetical protein [Pedobacter montanisoli]
MMKIFVNVILAFSFALFQEIDVKELKKDPVFIECRKAQKELIDGMITKKYQLPKNISREQIRNNRNKASLIKLYKDAGMKNAEEYFNLQEKCSMLMISFLKKHPELQKLDSQKRKETLKALFKS